MMIKNVQGQMEEVKAKQMVLDRGTVQGIGLLLRRIGGISLYAILIVGCWIAIASICYYENDFYNYMYNKSKFVGTWAPIAFVVFVNIIARPITKILISLEGWDF